MGSHLQRRHDDGGGDRPAREPQRDHRTEHPELPGGACQKESAGGKPGRGRMRRRWSPQRRTERRESYGNAGAVESVESQKQASPSFHEPLGNLAEGRRDSHISTAPATRRMGKWKTKSRLSTFPPPLLLFLEKQRTRSAGRAFALARRRAPHAA